jgi:hypothetical protein
MSARSGDALDRVKAPEPFERAGPNGGAARDWRGVRWHRMRRALRIALLALLFADASGLSSLVVPENCGVGTSESTPDSGCPAFCVRCTCACCASPVVQMAPVAVVRALPHPVRMPLATHGTLPSGVLLDILHIPKSLLA